MKRTLIFRWYTNLIVGLQRILRLDKVNRGRIPFIEQVLPKNGIGAELGVQKGYFSTILLQHTNALRLHLVDPWYFLTSHWSWADGNKSTIDALIKILKKFRKKIENGSVLIHVGDDLEVLTTFPDRYFDWVYIDSSHAYEHTKNELQILNRKVKINGVIAGDDWRPDPNHRHHGVYKAVNEFIVSENFRLIYSNSNDLQWAITRN